MSKYFNTKERMKKKYSSQTRKQQAINKAEKAAWLASPDGQAAIARIEAAHVVSSSMAPMIDKAGVKESPHSALAESLAEKAALHYRIKHGE